MDLKTIKLLAEYNKKTNRELGAFIAALTVPQWEKKFGGYFGSVKSLCNHIYICDFNWLKRFSKLRDFTYSKHRLFAQDLSFDETALETIEDFLKARKKLDAEIFEFTEELTPRDLGKVLTYTDSHGTVYKRPFGGLVLHLFNHQTHHRGMISQYLEEMKIPNSFCDLVEML